jgi:type I restriction enzyme M protein
MGIVLPESLLGNPSYEFLIQFIQDNATILGIATMPESLFKTSGKGGTHTKVAIVFLRKGKTDNSKPIFMADVKWCGHDSRGNPTIRKSAETNKFEVLDEVPMVVERYKALTNEVTTRDHLGFLP